MKERTLKALIVIPIGMVIMGSLGIVDTFTNGWLVQEVFYQTCRWFSDTCFHDPTWLQEMLD